MEYTPTEFDTAIVKPSRTYRRSDTIGALAAAMAKTQGALQPARQTKSQSAFRSGGTYAGLDDAWTSARGPLAANGLSIIQMPVESTMDGWVTLTTLLAHSSDEWIEATFSMPVEKVSAHGYGSCLSYLRRYTLNAFIGLVSTADYENDDGNIASGVTKRVIAKPDGFDEWHEKLKKSYSLMPKNPSSEVRTRRADEIRGLYESGTAEYREYLAQKFPHQTVQIKQRLRSK